jgi:hypothetical protein
MSKIKKRWTTLQDKKSDKAKYLFAHYRPDRIAQLTGLKNHIVDAIKLTKELTTKERTEINKAYKKLMTERLRKKGFSKLEAKIAIVKEDLPLQKIVKAESDLNKAIVTISKSKHVSIHNIKKGISQSKRHYKDWDVYIQEMKKRSWVPRLRTKGYHYKDVDDYFMTDALEQLRTMKMKGESLSKRNILAYDDNEVWQSFFGNMSSIDYLEIRRYLKYSR